MDLAFIERLMQLFERSSLAELEYGDASGRVRLGRKAGTVSGVPTAVTEQPLPQETAQAGGHARHEVKASFPGVFYRRAAPGQPPLAEIGDMVQEGQTLGMLEAMKLFNGVQADAAGRVTEIPEQDGAMVGAGATLFILDLAEPPS